MSLREPYQDDPEPQQAAHLDALQQQAAQFADVVRSLRPIEADVGQGVPGTALGGWSLGAQMALAVAARHPDKVGKLLLVAGTASFVQRDGWPHAMPPAMLARLPVHAKHEWLVIGVDLVLVNIQTKIPVDILPGVF